MIEVVKPKNSIDMDICSRTRYTVEEIYSDSLRDLIIGF